MTSSATNISALIADITAGVDSSPSGGVYRTKMPQIPEIREVFQTYMGGDETLAYAMLQIRKSVDRAVIARALGSALSTIFKDGTNFLGGSTKAIQLTGYGALTEEKVDPATVATTNFSDAEAVTRAEWESAYQLDDSEMAAYFGILCLAICKTPQDGDAMAAFNKNRRNNATKAIVDGTAQIFVDSSEWITYPILHKVHATFNYYAPLRIHLISNVLRHRSTIYLGAAEIFMDMFTLLADHGLTTLGLIRDAINKYPWIPTTFPELGKALQAANEGFRNLAAIDEAYRPYCKAMFANRIVLASPAILSNLVGVCREVLKYERESLVRYKGGYTSPGQDQIIAQKMIPLTRVNLSSTNQQADTPATEDGPAAVRE